MIQHTVAFRLNDTSDEQAFFARARRLADIDGVIDFRVLRQVGLKNDYTHALSMHFESAAEYDAYNTHPDHEAFVAEIWLSNVADFIELDYVLAEGR